MEEKHQRRSSKTKLDPAPEGRRRSSSATSPKSGEEGEPDTPKKDKPENKPKVIDLLNFDDEPGSPKSTSKSDFSDDDKKKKKDKDDDDEKHHHRHRSSSGSTGGERHHHRHESEDRDKDKGKDKEKKHHHKKDSDSEHSSEEEDEVGDLDDKKSKRRGSDSHDSHRTHVRRQTADGRMQSSPLASPTNASSPPLSPSAGPMSPNLHARRHTFTTMEQARKVDALSFLKKGTPFLKYGRHGFPHFRQFQLSDDNSKLVWFSKNKKMSKTQIDLADVDDIVLGQTTQTFERHLTPELDTASFSLLYHGRKRSLDLIAKNPTEFKVWTEGLRTLCQRARTGSRVELETLKELPVELPPNLQPPRSPGSPVARSEQAENPVGVKSSEKLEKSCRKELEEAQKKLKRLERESHETKIYVSSEYNKIQEILQKSAAELDAIQDTINMGDYSTADHDIWQVGVNLKSLDHMMASLEM